MTTSSIQDLRTFHSRKLLMYPSFNQSITSTSTSTSIARPPGGHDLLEPTPGGKSFDADVVLVFTVLLCALICSLGLNAVIKCALKCSRMVSSDEYSGNGTRSGSIEGKLANVGINKKALKMFPEVSYSGDLKIPGLESECVICLMEFSPGEKIRLLPKCNHGFHVKCIDRWLNCNSSCPTCRHCLIDTCNKIIGCGDANLLQSSNIALPRGAPPQVIINITSLEPEGMIHNFLS